MLYIDLMDLVFFSQFQHLTLNMLEMKFCNFFFFYEVITISYVNLIGYPKLNWIVFLGLFYFIFQYWVGWKLSFMIFLT